MVTLPMKPATSSNGAYLHLHSCGEVSVDELGTVCGDPGCTEVGTWSVLYVQDAALVSDWNALISQLPSDLHKFKIEV